MRRRMQGMDVASSIYFGAFNRALIIIPTYMTFMYINHKNDQSHFRNPQTSLMSGILASCLGVLILHTTKQKVKGGVNKKRIDFIKLKF